MVIIMIALLLLTMLRVPLCAAPVPAFYIEFVRKKRGKRFSVKAAKYITLNEVEYRPKWFWWE